MAEISWPWQYNFPPFFTEGNVHIVVQLEETDYVLRLIKEDEKPVHKEHIKNSLNFVNSIMVPLLKDHHYGIGEVVEIPPSSLAELCKDLQQYRSKKRLNKAVLSQFAIKTSNLAIVSSRCKSPAYCVEIKPKEGFISSSLKKYSKCYYCLKQYLKIHNNDIKQVSTYCPLNLFSGNKKRMKQSIESLIMNPQNNFKIFKNGMVVYHEKLRHDVNHIIDIHTPFDSKNLLADFIVEALLYEKESEIYVDESNTTSQSIPKGNLVSCDKHNNLKPNCVLYNILHLQKLSETAILNNITVTGQDYDYVPKMIDELQAMKLDLSNQKDREIYLKTVDPVHMSLISAIAKDCSIMISFSTEYVQDMPYIDVQDTSEKITRVYFKMAVTDLEPKPITTLLKRKCTEKKIIETYENYLLSLNKSEVNQSDSTSFRN